MMNLVMSVLIKFTTSIASLALLAGIILIATVTILDVASKKRDFAILKAISFRQRKVTTMVIFEYSIMSVITSIFATSLVYGIIDVMLKYELMISMCRAIAQNFNNIAIPYKRYQIQNAWRAENFKEED